MKLTTKRSELAAVLELSSRTVDKRATMPILQNFLLAASKDGLSVAATDLSVTVAGTVAATVDAPGSVTVKADDLAKMVAASVAEDVAFELKDKVLHLTCGRSRFQLPTIAPDDFPKLPAPPKEMQDVDGAAIKDAIGKVLHAVSRDSTRPHLNGVYLKIGGGNVETAATDGHRAAIATRPCSGDMKPFLMSTAGAVALLRLLGDGAKLARDPRMLHATTGAVSVSIAEVDAGFPDLTPVIPKQQAATITVKHADLEAALKAAGIVAESAQYRTGDGALTIVSHGDGGETSHAIEAGHKGAPITVATSIKYLINAIDHCGDTVRIGATGELDPITITDDGYTAVIMPLRY